MVSPQGEEKGDMTVSEGKDRKRSQLPRISVAELVRGGREAILLHDGIEYRLRLTSNGKLILTK
jgi:hemin uptake protein HemP